MCFYKNEIIKKIEQKEFSEKFLLDLKNILLKKLNLNNEKFTNGIFLDNSNFSNILDDFFGKKNSKPKETLMKEYKDGLLQVVFGKSGEILFLKDNYFYYVNGFLETDRRYLGQWQEEKLGSIYEEKIEDALIAIFHLDLDKKDIIRKFLKENKNV